MAASSSNNGATKPIASFPSAGDNPACARMEASVSWVGTPEQRTISSAAQTRS